MAQSSSFRLTSPAFEHEGLIPQIYTCDGNDISPPLKWEGAPAATQSFALISDDPDAPMGTWDHWLLFNIPASIHEFSQHLTALPAGTKVGKNSWGREDYGGPCPPDRIHRYFFKLYALDALLNLENGASKSAIEQALEGHILASTELMGRYGRLR
jgi:Raf kinase inhibitor-like YbhB/YbcL family protein